MRDILAIAAALARRAAQVPSGYQRVPFEHRPVRRFKNIPVRQRLRGGPNSFYLSPQGNSVVLVYDDELVEFEFDDMSMLREQVRLLETLKVRRSDFLEGLAKIIVTLGVIVVFLQFIIWLSS
uniref:hypothetical protein n=1 Tax=Mesorhizobium sp. WSM4875 TaxID=3038539 RepID=UPI002417DF8A|nr:hypothetical protein [Mesorhizobium sp. WSM4875]WIE94793.1 hypothetical protein P9270_030165 [Mesorhizobium sp. WSM4875]